MNKIRGAQAGFTLIELVVVIVILGILAATALPKFVDLSSEAEKGAAAGIAGAIASGSAINYSAKLAGKTSPDITVLNAADACNYATLNKFLKGVQLVAPPTSPATLAANTYTSSGNATCAGVAAGEAVACTITGSKGSTATATVICTGA